MPFLKLLLFFLICTTKLWAGSPSPWYSIDAGNKVQINVELYISSTCPHCHKADAFFHSIESTTPWLRVQRYVINNDKNALVRFNQLLNLQKMNDFAVPSVFFCNSRWTGFASAQTTGKDLLYGINYCKEQIEKKGELPIATETVLKRRANANLFDANMTADPSAIEYITMVALMDAFNPCALFCLAGFFALLFLQDKPKNQLTAGLLFILGMGVIHYFQQAYTSTFFEILPWLRWPGALVGLFTLYWVALIYRHKAMSNLYPIMTLLLALTLQFFQQTCVMNWAYVFEQWLFNKHLSATQTLMLEFAYQLMYLIPLFLTLVLYIIFSKVKRFTPLKKRLKFIGILLLIAISLLLIIYPMALANFSLSLFVIGIFVVVGFFLSKYMGEVTAE